MSENSVEVPAALLQERVLLDCGNVGAAAKIWVKDTYRGALPWAPFAIKVTDDLRPAPNRFHVVVANTEASWSPKELQAKLNLARSGCG